MVRWIASGLGVKRVGGLGLAMLVVAAVLAGSGGGPALAQDSNSSATSADSMKWTGPHMCTVNNVAVFESRIHVRCTTAPGAYPTVFYFAASTSNAMFANRLLTLMNTALALGKPLGIYYEPSASYNPAGCNSGDCRAISWIYLNQ